MQTIIRNEENYYDRQLRRQKTMTTKRKIKIKDLYQKIQEIKGKFKPRLEMLTGQ